MTTWVRRTIIVTAANAPLARALCDGIAPGGSGSNMLVTPLGSTAQGPATHYVSSGMIWAEFAAMLADPNAIYAAAQAAGAPVTLAQCQALVTQSDVSDIDVEDPFAAFARLGLVMVQA